MELTVKTFLIACPLVFLAGLIDAIGAKLSLGVSDSTLKMVLVPTVFVAGFFVFHKNLFGKSGCSEISLRLVAPVDVRTENSSSTNSRLSSMLISFIKSSKAFLKLILFLLKSGTTEKP